MALYESVIIGRQDLTPNQFEELIDDFIKIIESFKGVIKKRENWGLRNLAYKINKNRKGHYVLLNIDSSSDAIIEYERLMRLNEDIIRFLTIRISSVDEKSSPLMNNKSDRYKSEVFNTEVTSSSNVEA
ncbi:MAG: 30S ribosomal protein S6 [Candidatus Puniceispirillales bacterium]